ncbi:hypothetical protein Glove_300g21 [Diversispora epigaea]|uniref:Uncharacterized protein n=1 Tax=Diversispora epigaea TaxID=1348612 RepID=A0A397HX47_9GLOM|nr:hypothetical protein Glove_300g21 [Diversispora epigaea]
MFAITPKNQYTTEEFKEIFEGLEIPRSTTFSIAYLLSILFENDEDDKDDELLQESLKDSLHNKLNLDNNNNYRICIGIEISIDIRIIIIQKKSPPQYDKENNQLDHELDFGFKLFKENPLAQIHALRMNFISHLLNLFSSEEGNDIKVLSRPLYALSSIVRGNKVALKIVRPYLD